MATALIVFGEKIVIKDKELTITEKTILRLISTLLITAIGNMFIQNRDWTSMIYVEGINPMFFILCFVVAFAVLSLWDWALGRKFFPNGDALLFAVFSLLFGFFMLITKKDIYLTVITVFFVLLALGYVLNRFPRALKRFEISRGQLKGICIFVMVLTLLYVGTLVVLRYFLFKTPCYDFGIFSQMYYYMKETGLPMTTCERSTYLSHFAIHFSPIFYVILPIYMIFPHPVTLIICQLLIVMSGAIPCYLMCRKRKYSNLITLAIVLTFILYPTMRSGLFFDFHENKFLVPCLLWLLYFLDNREIKEERRNIGIFVFALLSLMVKEDAPIYVACIGLYCIAGKKDRRDKLWGIFLLLFSVIYFFIVFYCLNTYGSGSAINSIGRYQNLMTSESSGLFGMLMNMVRNPMYVIKELLTEEKLSFIFWTMLPVLFIPLMAKKISMYILLIPYMVINLLTDYTYQYDINFQYTFGSCTLIIYMVIVWFEGGDTLKKRYHAVLMTAAALLVSVNSLADRNPYFDEAKTTLEANAEVFELFETIPEHASVSANTWFVPALSQREYIYEYEYAWEIRTDYMVFDIRTKTAREKNEEIVSELTEEGYEIYAKIEDKVIIIRRKN